MTTPLVTIAIPAYKTEFLAEAIASALAQTYASIEVLVVDDASPADVEAVVSRYSDPRLVYCRNARNLGAADPSRNWQRCLALARGEFICILCDDDVYAPDYVQTLLALAERYPSCAAFRSGVQEIDGAGKVTGYYALALEHESMEEYIWHYFSRNNHQTISEWMLRVSALKAIGGYVACPAAWGSDCATVFLLAEKGGVGTSPQRLMSFRDSGINITGLHYRYNRLKVLGWQCMCDVATGLLQRSTHPDRAMMAQVVEHERRRELRKLFRHSSVSELCAMIMNRHRYGLPLSYFVLMMLRNPFWCAIARHRRRR